VTDTRPELLASRVVARVEPAYRLARAILLDDEDAADVVQDACVTAWARAQGLRDVDRFDAWFDRIVVNLCRDRIRRRRLIRTIPARNLLGPTEPSSPETDPDLDAALDSLGADHRIVVLLRYWQDLTVDEIARRLEIRSGTVKSRLHYALRMIRTRLEMTDGRP